MRDYLKELKEKGEHGALEAKTASEIGEAVLRTICAFANGPSENLHILLLGVKERRTSSRAYEVSGISDIDKITTALTTTCRQKLSRSVDIEILPRCSEGKNYLEVQVKGAQSGEKPVAIISGKAKGVYIRVGASR